MTRRGDWRRRLSDYIRASRNRPCEYGVFDCCLFAAGAIDAQVEGSMLVELHRGAYSDLSSGLAFARRLGVGSPLGMARKLLKRISPPKMMLGDIAVIDTPEGPAFTVVQGSHLYAVGKDDLMLLERTAARIAFTI